MRIVLDTNVVLSAVLWRGLPYRLLQAARSRRQAQLFASAALVDELAEVLLRPVPTARLALIGLTAAQVIADYVDAVDVVTPLATPRVVIADADDDHVVAAAVAAEAEFIVSGDRHLLDLGNYLSIRIVAPTEAYAVFQARQGG